MNWSNSTRRQRLPSDWASTTRRIKARDAHRCVQCGSTANLQVDHVVPNDDHRDANLQTLCRPCHQDKTIREREAKRLRLTRPPERHPGLT